MTGEITLRGRVLPIGGLRENVLAAHRAGIRTVILPSKNEVDLDELTPEVRQEMKFILVDNIEEVLEAALPDTKLTGPPPAPRKRRASKTEAKGKREPAAAPV